MTTTSSRTADIAAIRRLPADAASAVKGLTDEQLDTPYRPGGWSIRQVVHHIADSHINAYIRMKLIVTEEHPTLKPYDQDIWSNLIDAATLPLDASLTLLEGLHARWSTFLDAIESEEEWSRTAYHPENGEVTLGSLLQSYAEHGEHHVEQIRDLCRRMGWAVGK